MFCKNCGQELPDGTKFCTDCGAQTAMEAQQTPPVQPAQPVMNQSYQMPMMPPKKKFPAWAIVLIVLGALIGVALIGIVFGTDDDPVKTTASSQAGAQAESQTDSKGEVIAKVGETLDYNGLKITFDSVEKYEDKTEFPIDKTKEGNIFVLLRFTVSNETSEDQYVNMFYEESYCDDAAIDPTAMLIHAEGETLWGDVAVGKKRSGYVAYEVPADWKTLEFYYSPEVFKDTKMMFKAEASDMK